MDIRTLLRVENFICHVLRTPEIFLNCHEEEVKTIFLSSAAIGSHKKSGMICTLESEEQLFILPQQTILYHSLHLPKKTPERKRGNLSLKYNII